MGQQIKKTTIDIPQEIIGMCFAAFVILTVIVSMVYWSSLQRDEAEKWVSHTHKVIENLDLFVSHVKDAETGIRGYIISREQRYLSPYQFALPKLEEDIQKLRILTKDNTQQQLSLDRIESLVNKRLEVLDRMKKYIDSGRVERQELLLLLTEGKTYMDEIRASTSFMVEREHELLDRRAEKATESSLQMNTMLVVGFVAVIILISCALYLINREMLGRKKSAEILRQTEERFRLLINSSQDYAIYMLDPDGNIKTWNDGATRLTGYNTVEAIGKHFSIFYPQEAIDNGHPEYELQVTRGKGRFEEEGWRIRKDGTRFWANVIISAMRNNNGELMGYAKIIRDLTSKREAELALKDSEERYKLTAEVLEEQTVQLKAVNQELEAFCYSVSHDLRAPLRTIDGFSQAILESAWEKLDDDEKDYLDRVRKGSQQMSELIDDMLNLSRITRGNINIQENVNLSVFAYDIIADLKNQDPDRVVEVYIQPNMTAKCDPQLMRAVLQNLLGNAWKFTQKHSTANIRFGTIPFGDGFAYYVKDDGAGFDMAYVNKLFGVFQRLHRTAEFKGTGVGLATVQRIIHRHGGKIWAEGAVENGATFYFTLDSVKTIQGEENGKSTESYSLSRG